MTVKKKSKSAGKSMGICMPEPGAPRGRPGARRRRLYDKAEAIGLVHESHSTAKERLLRECQLH